MNERFWSKVAFEPNSGCWLWLGCTGGNMEHRYGQLWISGKMVSAHRLSYEMHKGSIGPGLCVLHKCDVSLCLNPDHLFLGTKAANSADMVAKNRQARGALNSQAKLTEAQVRSIRDDQRWHRIIAADYGVSPSIVGFIKTGRKWAWLT